MRSGQKLALSLLISVVLFALFSVAAFSGLFPAVEARFYQPKIMSDKKQRLESVLAAETEYFDALSKRFKDFSSADAVRSALSRDGSQRFMEARESLREKLFAGTTCLGGIRLIDKNGVNIHYSTYDSDILSKTDESKILKKYTEIGEVPFQSVNTDAAAGKIFFDEAKMGMHKVQAAFNEELSKDDFSELSIINFSQKGKLINMTVKGSAQEVEGAILKHEPVFMESLPLTLEEVFISEMEAAGYDINNITG